MGGGVRVTFLLYPNPHETTRDNVFHDVSIFVFFFFWFFSSSSNSKNEIIEPLVTYLETTSMEFLFFSVSEREKINNSRWTHRFFFIAIVH